MFVRLIPLSLAFLMIIVINASFVLHRHLRFQPPRRLLGIVTKIVLRGKVQLVCLQLKPRNQKSRLIMVEMETMMRMKRRMLYQRMKMNRTMILFHLTTLQVNSLKGAHSLGLRSTHFSLFSSAGPVSDTENEDACSATLPSSTWLQSKSGSSSIEPSSPGKNSNYVNIDYFIM